jgi:putative heme-binding domain-containing protein
LERLQDFENAMNSNHKPSADSGKIVFVQKCAPCHSINSEGGDIGPNLDGVAQWGPKALAEKILDPNRNISENFRMYSVRLKDGKVSSGLYRREEGAVIVFADLTGKEFSIAKKDIAEQTPSKLTLMPDNFRETLSQQEFNALIQFLLNPKNVKK